MRTQPLLVGKDLLRYHEYLQSDHDYRIFAEVMPLDESKVVAEPVLLDGQVNYSKDNDGPWRTASIVLSDPAGALQFGTSYADDPTGEVWVSRLVRLRHEVTVPTLGDISATCMVGVPTAVSRSGGEISLELGDKSLLADHGVRPRTYKKGTRVDVALRSILADLTGERHMRIPPARTKSGKPKKLSRPYTVGMGENALTPWRAFRLIANNEAGWRSYYSADGYATCEPKDANSDVVPVLHLLALPEASTSFEEFSNYVKVTSTRKIKHKKNASEKAKRNVAMEFQSVAVLPRDHDLSEQNLGRNGVPQTRPLVVDNNNLKTQKAVNDEARQELKQGSGLESEQSYETMPFYHLDPYDRLDLPLGVGQVEFDDVSIPLGTGGNMTLGKMKWVSKPVLVKRAKSKTRVIRKKKKKGGKKDG
jgi:hypothetical protein